MSEPADFRSTRRPAAFRDWIAIVVILAAGLACAWSARNLMNPDGVSYLDLSDAIRHGNWRAATGAYWSPFYPTLIALFFSVVRPSAAWEFPAVHLLNFLIFGFAFVSFLWFFKVLNEDFPGADRAGALWSIFGYSIFLFGTIQMVPQWLVTPDLLVVALVLLAATIALRALRSEQLFWYGLEGIVLGFSYLAKAVFWPLGGVLMVLIVVFGTLSIRRIIRSLAMVAGFVIVAAPWVIRLHSVTGSWQTSEAGAINYAEFVNGAPLFTGWLGQPGNVGVPRHPPRVARTRPTVLEYRTPIPGTYPLWYDPAYWYSGIKPHFDFAQQKARLASNTVELVPVLKPALPVLIGAIALLFFCSKKILSVKRRFAVLIWCISAFGGYLVVHVESRFLAGFFIVGSLLVYRMLLEAVPARSNRVFAAILACVACGALIPVVRGFPRVWKGDLSLHSGDEEWSAARAMSDFGIRQGDEIGSVGNPSLMYFARLSRVSFIAEVEDGGVAEFWEMSHASQLEVLNEFRRSGARAVVAREVPHSAFGEGWTGLSATAYAIFLWPDETNQPNSRARRN